MLCASVLYFLFTLSHCIRIYLYTKYHNEICKWFFFFCSRGRSKFYSQNHFILPIYHISRTVCNSCCELKYTLTTLSFFFVSSKYISFRFLENGIYSHTHFIIVYYYSVGGVKHAVWDENGYMKLVESSFRST